MIFYTEVLRFVLQIILLCNDNFFCIRKCFDPITEGMPLSKFMSTSRKEDIDQCFIVHSYCTHLIVAGRKKLDHIIPVLFLFSFFHIFLADFFQLRNNTLHKYECIRCHMVMAEVIHIKRFCMDLVHCACGVSHSCNFVSVKFFPINGLSFTIACDRTPFRFSETSFPKISLRINSSPTPPPGRHRG